MTTEEVKKLTDDELRIRVAELRGYKRASMLQPGTGLPLWEHPTEMVHATDGTPLFPHRVIASNLPNYPQDLNAMHEVEDALTEEQYNRFCDILWNMCGGASGKFGAIHSTARQRAEAFVLTMEKI